MKKIIFALSIVGLTSTSCLKKHTCQCFDSTGFSPGPSSLTTSSKSEREQFKSDCEKADKAQKTAGGHCDYN